MYNYMCFKQTILRGGCTVNPVLGNYQLLFCVCNGKKLQKIEIRKFPGLIFKTNNALLIQACLQVLSVIIYGIT